jgi:hypothetical protein
MIEAPEDNVLPPHLTYLKRLVTALAVVMIAGFVVLILTLVIRLNAPAVAIPDEITLPDGQIAQAVTFGDGWYAVVTEDQTLLVFQESTGALLHEAQITTK